LKEQTVSYPSVGYCKIGGWLIKTAAECVINLFYDLRHFTSPRGTKEKRKKYQVHSLSTRPPSFTEIVKHTRNTGILLKQFFFFLAKLLFLLHNKENPYEKKIIIIRQTIKTKLYPTPRPHKLPLAL